MIPLDIDSLPRLPIAVGLTLFAYWGLDLLLRRGGGARTLARLGLSSRGASLAVAVAVAAGTPFFTWNSVAGSDALRIFASALAVMMAWKSATEDIDVAGAHAHWLERGLLVATAIGVWFSPLWIALQLQVVTLPFHGWKHHGTWPLRAMQLALAFVLAAAAMLVGGLDPQGSSAYLLLLAMMFGSHYVITAVAKGMLGPKWYSWMLDNHLHQVVASAYVWGWARFLPESLWKRFVAICKRVERPLQVSTFIAEGLAPLALLDPAVALGLLFVLSAFHVGVFLTTGILFWEWIVTNTLAMWLITASDPAVVDAAFGLWPFLGGVFLMGLLPLRGRLWAPTPLGWWDTPLTQRVQWVVRGESGERYGLHNDFMCPHERLYGRVHGCFMIDEPVFTYHLGEVWMRELRDRIRALRDDPRGIDAIRAEYAISVLEPKQTARHVAYLERFLGRVNAGQRKFVLPRALRWLKAPGGQFYYWGELPRFRGQEKASEVEVWFHEQWWDGEVRHDFTHKKLFSFPVPDLSPECATELDEKEVDAMVLIRAQGKLVQVPEWMVTQAKELYG